MFILCVKNICNFVRFVIPLHHTFVLHKISMFMKKSNQHSLKTLQERYEKLMESVEKEHVSISEQVSPDTWIPQFSLYENTVIVKISDYTTLNATKIVENNIGAAYIQQ